MSSASLLHVAFSGRQTQEHYLERFKKYSPETREAFCRIYNVADPKQPRHHIHQVFLEAGRHPQLYPIIRENVILRFWLAWGTRWKDMGLIKKIREHLEDFHLASKAFVKNVSLDVAAQEASKPFSVADVQSSPASLAQSLVVSNEEERAQFAALWRETVHRNRKTAARRHSVPNKKGIPFEK